MRVFSTKREVREYLRELRARGRRIGLVPTMGALHEGHLSLVEAVRPHCDVVVMWVFLNPTQFNSKTDYERYPRVLERDLELAEGAGVDVVFAPEVSEIYPAGVKAYLEKQSVRVYAGDRSWGLCGAGRPGHFDGVVHVVAAFFNILEPDVAVFGEKDYQQVRVISQLVRDLHYDIEIIQAPIIRERSGLARSSRNTLLGEKSQAAAVIAKALFAARDCVRAGEGSIEMLCETVAGGISSGGLEVEYVEIVDIDTLEPLREFSGRAQLVVAARAGEVRLIDNIRLEAV